MVLSLPIDAVLPDLVAALRGARRAVLVAPPGAGKTTRVPLALRDAFPDAGRIVMLEPRRLAARAAAERMAATLGEAVGDTVGYRIRGEARVGRRTRIEVVTEGILTRMIQSDPGLTGIGAVIFDEFHERSLNADLGLALTWDCATALREDLMVVVMSATLDAAPVADLMGGAPVIRAEGRAFPVETRWLPQPLGPDAPFETSVARLILDAAGVAEGGLLAFLPGEREIRRVSRLIDGRLPGDCDLRVLYGAMDFAAQRAALAPPAPGRRNLVLATAIAETSLTLPGIAAVVDAGRARHARYDPASGMTRLVTERVTRAEAEQRRGRAGRERPGLCFRLWARAEEGGLDVFPPPEIASADLAGLSLELALWGSDGADLAFLTPPPAPALAEARALLADLGAMGGDGRITAHGRRLAALPLHPRLAHMLVTAGPDAAPLAALLEDRDPMPGAGADVTARLAALAGRGGAIPRPAADRLRAEAARLARMAGPVAGAYDTGEMAALAYPDRIGLRRPAEPSAQRIRYALSGGKGAWIAASDPLSRARLVVATELDGDPREARIRQGAALGEDALRRLFGARIARAEAVEWSRREGRVTARTQERFGALVLSEGPLVDPSPGAVALAALTGLRELGLSWSDPARRLAARIAMVRGEGAALPDCSDAALLDGDGLLPWLAGCRTASDLRGLDLVGVLHDRIGPEGRQLLDRLAPAAFVTPLGRPVPIDYDGETPTVALRLRELFGVTVHPAVGPRRRPLRITLLSPAGRPVQVTTDLPGFWAGGYAEVRKDMRGRYPKHPWPEDPTAAAPTLRARPRT
ncbi:MAG: ATP-dependent helicase HrpB [Paracoccaceae bacterium]